MSLKQRLGLGQEPLFLVDGSSFLYRGYHAYPDLKRSDGFPTNALFIVLRILARIVREENPAYLGFFLDGRGPNFRHALYPAYKANRPGMPEDLAVQVEPLKEAVGLLGLALEVPEGVEADDRIAALAARFKAERPVVIVGSDKDLKQCLDSRVYLWDPGSKKDSVASVQDFVQETGLQPGQWPDYQALCGDAADNIPGAPGVGPKTALALLRDFPSLEALREGLDRVPESARRKVAPVLDQIFVYRELTRLRLDGAGDVPLEAFARRQVDPAALSAFLQAYEFRSLARELAGAGSAEASGGPGRKGPARKTPRGPVQGSLLEETPAPRQAQLSLFDAAPAPVPVPEPRRAASPADLPDCAGRDVGLAWTGEGFRLGLDGQEWLLAPGVPETASPASVLSTVVPASGPDPDPALAPALAAWLAPAGSVAVPELKVLLASHPAWRTVPLARWFDCSLAAYLLAPEERNYGLERLVLGLSADPQAPEASIQAPGTALAVLAGSLKRRLAASGLDRLVRDLELPLVPVLADMEAQGVRIDARAFAAYLEEVNGQLAALTREIVALAGEEFNIRSSQQLARVLFDRLGLKPSGKTEGGALSTSVEALEKLAGKHPVIDRILEYRTLEKLRSTYLEPLPRLADAGGRVHTTFNQLATATGRLSSSGPNLQNIPIRGPQGQRVRALFTAGEGRLLAGADYSQIELRVLAHFSGDPALVEAFAQGVDIHTRTAALLLDKAPDTITPDERRSAKTVNFGLIYGMGPQKLARELGVTLNEAKAFIERYFARLARLKEFYENVVEEATARGYVTTLAGRRRLLPELASRNQNLVAQARRQAINTVIQGSAADIIKMAMLAVHGDPVLTGLSARLVLQVHDELLLEVPEATAREAGERLRGLMQSVTGLSVPLKVDLSVGPNWSLAH